MFQSPQEQLHMSQRLKDGHEKRKESLDHSGSNISNNFNSFIFPSNSQIKETYTNSEYSCSGA